MIGGCSEQTRYRVLSVFFEGVPKPGEKTEWVLAQGRVRRAPPVVATPTPVLELVMPKREFPPGWLPALLKTMPHDAAGYPDMVAAFKEKQINPLPGAGQDHAVPKEVLDKDIALIPKGKLKCIFSHQVHTSWIDCKSCHPGLFKETTGEEMAMTDFDSGRFCGACHGKVSFPVKGECVRCHSGMKKKEAKEPPKEKLMTGKITLARADSKDSLSKQFPPATFPHLPHRVAYRCYACHDRLFPMKKGATKPITMDEISAGNACGACHNGKLAFAADNLSNCSRCHLQ